MFRNFSIRSEPVVVVFKSRKTLLWLGVAGSGAIVFLIALIWLLPSQSADEIRPAIPAEIAGLDLASLQKQVSLTERRLQKLQERQGRLLPSGPVILIDSAANQISLMQGSKVIIKDKCSTGSGLELTDTGGHRTWTFDTPRGYFRVLSKTSNPVWYRPDWAFVEEGIPIPKDRASRAVPDVLGAYAIAFGDGYFLHGTLYTRTLGSSVTHGCIRLDDETLKKIYQTAQPGTPIWIY